jgi:MFS family permease
MQFGVSREPAIVPLSLYTLGMGIGSLFTAPLSELFGRRILYLMSMPLFLVFTSGSRAAKNIQTHIVCRFLAGALGTAPLAIGAGTINNIWDLERDGGIAGLLFIMAPFLGPCLGELADPLVYTCVLTSQFEAGFHYRYHTAYAYSLHRVACLLPLNIYSFRICDALQLLWLIPACFYGGVSF